MKRRLLFLPMLAALLAASDALADEIPSYTTLRCENACPNFVPAKLLTPMNPRYPGAEVRGFNEGVVDFAFTIGTDGRVKNLVVEQLIGSTGLRDAGLDALKNAQYQPATEDGKPVEQNSRLRMIFRVSGANSARYEITNAYNRAVDLTNEGQLNDAMAALRDVAAVPELNFYEQEHINSLLAGLEARTGDYSDALRDIRIATFDRGRELEQTSMDRALRLRIELEAHEGQWADAFAWFEILKKQVTPLTPEDPEAVLVAKLHALIDGAAPLAMDAEIAVGDDPHWQHTMLRRRFSFIDIQGKLDKFDLRCDSHGIESAISDKAEWTIPPSWSKCLIYIYGTPGATFRFVERQPDAATTQASHS